ncbi:hypothetical protein [Nocardia tengchongensis]|uniref:hypothetical protein n=1 Tax=Nocardia tengchongensis TaxID=2055889 RepID=UPI00368C2DD1
MLIRQLDALTEIADHTADVDRRRVLIDQAAMIERAVRQSITEESDRADVLRRYRVLLARIDRERSDQLAAPE